MAHTLRFHCGFEREDLMFWSSYSGSPTIEKTITSFSNVALKFTLSASTASISFLGEGMDVGGHWVDNNRNYYGRGAVHIYWVSLPTSGTVCYLWRQSDATIQRRHFSVEENGKIQVRGEGSPGSVEATSTGQMTTGVWYVLSWYCTSTYLRVVVRNRDTGATVIDVSGTSSGSSSTRYSVFGATYTSTGTFVIDNFVWESDATEANVDDPVNLMTTKYAINQQLPKGAGYYTGGTNDWTYVDEVPHDSDTTYRNIDSQQFTDVMTQTSVFPTAVGTVHAVMFLAVSRNNACTGSSNVQVLIRSGTTDSASGSGWCSTSYVNPKYFRTTDPATSAAWTVSAVDSVQVGCVEAGTNAQGFITAVSTEVLYSTYKIERLPRIAYSVSMMDEQAKVMNFLGESIDYDEIRANEWTRYLDMLLPAGDARDDYWMVDDLAYNEGVSYTQDEQGGRVSIASSPDDFVERLVTKIALSSGGTV